MFAFLRELLALLLGKSGPELLRKRAVRRIKKTITANRYKRFYKHNTQELTPAAAKFFYEIYRTVSAAQAVWKGTAGSAGFKNIVVRHFMPAEAMTILDELSEEALQEKMRRRNEKDTVREARNEFRALEKILDRRVADLVNNCCSQALVFEQFASFDYYFLLKKFGSQFREHSVSGNHNFNPAKGASVSGELKDFLSVSLPLESGQDWVTIFKLLKTWNGTDAVRTDQWLKTFSLVQEVNNSRILELVIRHIDGDPEWAPRFTVPREQVLSAWIEAKRKDVDATLGKLARAKWNAHIGEFADRVFGKGPVSGLSWYTAKAEEPFLARGFQGFVHAEGLNYLAAFTAIFSLEMRELCELLMIRAIWSISGHSQGLMEQCLVMDELAGKIEAFDEAMRNDGVRGYKLYQSLGRVEKDSLQEKSVRDSLTILNAEARSLLLDGGQALTVIQKTVEEARVDYNSPAPLLILNWGDLEQAAAKPLGKWLSSASAKLTPFMSMMSLFVQDESSALVLEEEEEVAPE